MFFDSGGSYSMQVSLLTNPMRSFRPATNHQVSATRVSPQKLDQVCFGASKAVQNNGPSFQFVRKSIQRFAERPNLQWIKSGFRVTPLEGKALWFNHETRQPVIEGDSYSYLILSKSGQLLGKTFFTKNKSAQKPPERWKWTSLQTFTSQSRIQGEEYKVLSKLRKTFPNASIQYLDGYPPASATGGLTAFMVQPEGQPAQVHIVTTVNSIWPGTYTDDEYPLKPGQILSKEDFLANVVKLGRLKEESSLVHKLSGSPKEKVLSAMVGSEKATALLQAVKPLKLQTEGSYEAIKQLVKTQMAGQPIDLKPYYDEFVEA
jgi:hypothetical protein